MVRKRNEGGQSWGERSERQGIWKWGATSWQAWRRHGKEEKDSFLKGQMNMGPRLILVRVRHKWGRGGREVNWALSM